MTRCGERAQILGLRFVAARPVAFASELALTSAGRDPEPSLGAGASVYPPIRLERPIFLRIL